jgi:glutamate-5-semialdehyde dehydrogenase
MQAIGTKARAAYGALAVSSELARNQALVEAARAIRASKEAIQTANNKDMELAKQKGLSGAMIDRLVLNDDRIEAMAKGVEAIAELPDPLGHTLWETERPNGLRIARVSVPLGVIGIIYESRPNVTADAAALCIKSGNAAILRGGSESFHSSTAIAECMHAGLQAAGLSGDAVQLVPTRDRAAVGEMLRMVEVIDIIVPRGGRSLTERVQGESRIPTIQHLDGNCHTYIHSGAEIDKAISVIVNAKMRRTGICGATESIVMDEAIAGDVLPSLVDALAAKDCEVRGDATAQSMDNRIIAAEEVDWGTEYLDAIVSVKIVQDVAEAIAHVNRYSSHHTDAIITENQAAADQFLREVDSAIVMQNASTQFADGGEFGMGAEIGISTGRLHARGPVGCDQLTTYKYVVRGDGQVRA